MIIQTSSRRFATAARLCRLFPPIISGRLATRLYPLDLALRENAAFRARSSLTRAVLSMPGAEETTWAFALRGFYEWRNVLIANQVCRPGDTIVEIGANLGTETVAFSAIVGQSGRVIGFEALPQNFQSLQAAVEANGLANVTLYPQAVASRNGEAHFAPPPDPGNLGTGRLTGGDASLAAIRVQTVTLDSADERHGFGAIRLLSMDVEGAEMEVLRGGEALIRRCRPFVLLEVNPDLLATHGAAPADLADYFARHGYSCWQLGSRGLRPVGDLPAELNWLAIPTTDAAPARRVIKVLNRAMWRAALLPLWCGVNPMVPSTRVRGVRDALRGP